MKSRTESIQEELELREEEIRLKVESILDEEDEYVREEMILGLDEDELEAFNEALDELEEDVYEKKAEGISTLFEMANLQKDESGLPYDIWIDSSGKDRITKHNIPRIKVRVENEMIPIVLFSKDNVKARKEFKHSWKVIEWAKANYDIILRHWNKEISDRTALTLLCDN